MSKRKQRRYKLPSPPPGDAGNYLLVSTREGSYWRRRRGTIKKAKLNPALKKHAQATTVTSPAAKRVRDKLDEFLRQLDTGRFIANVSARLKKTYLKTGQWNFSQLDGYELQPDYPLGELLRNGYFIEQDDTELVIRIPITGKTLRPLNKHVSDYFFDLILLYGDPSIRNGLRIESQTSALYPVSPKLNTQCRLNLELPPRYPWMALLKLSCLEGNELAAHPRHYAMKVVRVRKENYPPQKK